MNNYKETKKDKLMPRKSKKEKIKSGVNERHIKIYDKLLDNIEYLLEGFSKGIPNVEYEFTEVPKSAISTLDFLVASVVKIQKGHRIALGLDDDLPEEESEPKITFIQGVDFKKI